MIIYVENLRESTKKLLELNKQSWHGCKIQGYCTKVNHFPIYQQWTSGIWSSKHITIYINLTNRYKSNKICLRSLWRKLQNWWKLSKKNEIDIPCSRIGRLNIVKMSVLLNLIFKFNAILINILASYFVDTDKLILKFIWRG